jgi:PTH2 family peptidyl-tRNA hydrolase
MAELRPPPTPLALLIGTAIVAGVSGYMIGIASSLGLLPNPFAAKEPRRRGVDNYDDEEESEAEDIDSSILDHAPNWANGVEADKKDGLRATTAKKAEGKKEEVAKTAWEGSNEECKLVLVVRTDLGMTKGSFSFLLHNPLILTDFHRQNRSTMRPRDVSMLQEPPPRQVANFEKVGENGSSEGCAAGQE